MNTYAYVVHCFCGQLKILINVHSNEAKKMKVEIWKASEKRFPKIQPNNTIVHKNES